jgi:hypothetical protein
VLRDTCEGTIVWQAREPDCADTVLEIYHGVGLIHRRKSEDPKALRESIVMIASEEEGGQ